MRFIIFLCLLLVGPSLLNAQSNGLLSGQGQPNSETGIILNPKSPEPETNIAAGLHSNVGDGSITWLLNGSEIENTKNLRRINFTVSDADETYVLRAIVSNEGITLADLERTIIPRHVDIILEAQTYSPEFYLGRSLASPESLVNATVLISGIDDYSNLLFKWTLNQDVINSGQALGRNAISFETGIRANPILTVEVTDLEGNEIAKDNVLIHNEPPYVELYEADTLLGLSDFPIIGNWNMVGNTSVIRAVPFNMDSRAYNDPDIIEWEIDGSPYENTSSNPYEITLQKNNSDNNRSQLEFHVRDTSKLIQGGRADVNINL